MDHYHEFKRAHDIQIEGWRLYWSLNYVFVTMGIMAPSSATITPSIRSASGNGNATGNGAIGSGGTTQLWNFSMSCDKITNGLQQKSYGIEPKSYGIYRISNVSKPHESL